ncbi:hypothetical protein QWZ10_05955 [Paracoccus cavernae]|uniref:Uncharacterized protein n=1 Tax=Paracoccus cavernae TaxID=1571207 RepID=A0ABT8D3V1_9RHOB|nr:hypothetical protein [Paracoccus cavernae]
MRNVLFAAALCTTALPAYAAEERGIVVLSGNVWADGARSSIEGRAMICGLKGPSSFLSLRTAPIAPRSRSPSWARW